MKIKDIQTQKAIFYLNEVYNVPFFQEKILKDLE